MNKKVFITFIAYSFFILFLNKPLYADINYNQTLVSHNPEISSDIGNYFSVSLINDNNEIFNSSTKEINQSIASVAAGPFGKQGIKVSDDILIPFSIANTGNYLINIEMEYNLTLRDFKSSLIIGAAEEVFYSWIEGYIRHETDTSSGMVGVGDMEVIFHPEENDWQTSLLKQATFNTVDAILLGTGASLPAEIEAIREIYSYINTAEGIIGDTHTGTFSLTFQPQLTANDQYYVFLKPISGCTAVAAGAALDIAGLDLLLTINNITITPTNIVDNSEPNDSFEDASYLGTLTSTLNISGLSIGPENSDEDWFKFYIMQTGDIGNYVKISFNHAEGDIDLCLYKQLNPSLYQKIGCSDSSSNVEEISLSGLEGGTYIIKVYGYYNAINPDYTLTINPPGDSRQQGNHLSIDYDHILWEESGNDDNDGHPELGEEAGLIVPIRSSVNVQYVEATLSASPFSVVDITDDIEYYGSIAEGGSATGGGQFDMDILQANINTQFTLHVEYEYNGYFYYQDFTFLHSFPEEIPPLDFKVIDFTLEMNPDDDWNSNGILNSGDEAWIRFKIQNDGDFTAYDVRAALDPEVGIQGVHVENDYLDYEGFGDIGADASAWPLDVGDHWRIDADYNYSGTFAANVKIYHDGRDENDPIIIENAVQVTVYPQPRIDVRPDDFDFGVTASYELVELEASVRNHGSSDLVINGIDFVIPDGINVDIEPAFPWNTIAPGEILPITITIDASGFEGQIDPPIEVIMQTDASYSIEDEGDRIKITGLVSNAAPAYNIPNEPTGRNPDVSGSIVVWQDTRNGNQDIYALDLETGEEMQITSDASSQVTPKISGNLIVWRDARNKQPDDSNYDIYGYDLTSGQEFIVSNDPAEEHLIGVDGNQIAFRRAYYILDHYEDGTQFDELFNLFLFEYNGSGGGTEQNLTGFTEGSHFSNKETVYYNDNDFGGGTLAWEESTYFWETQYTLDRWDNTNYRLRKMQVSPGSCGVDASPVTVYTGSVGTVSADNCRIVYEKNYQIYIWENDSITQLTPIPENVESESRDPAIGGNFVTYWKEVNVSGTNPEFFVALDLRSGEETVITEKDIYDEFKMDENLLVYVESLTNNVMYTYLQTGKAPSLFITDPSEDVTVSNSVTSYVLSGTSSDSDGSITKVDYRVGEGAWQSASGTTDWSFTLNNLSIGENNIEIRANDNDGNYSLLKNRNITRNSPPNIIITIPIDNHIAVNATEYRFTGNASDLENKVKEITYRINGGYWQMATGTSEWNFVASNLIVGDNLVEVRSQDIVNDYSEIERRKITIDLSLPLLDSDNDGDGMDDGWEELYGLDPFVYDADGDDDRDGFSNIKEYMEGTDPLDSESHPPRALPWLILLLGDS
ncbi:hypothetical protein ACFL6W_04775 [Thermodesulfobacteriota bacterium]